MYKVPQSYNCKLLTSWIHFICNKQTHIHNLELCWMITSNGLSTLTNVANKAIRMLDFLKRYLSKCSSNVKTSAYLLMVHPLMEYACVVWDLHYQSQVLVLEKVQRRAARWVLSYYRFHSSVSSMLEQLNWLPLAKRRKQQRLNLFYQIMNGEIGLSLPDCYYFTNKHTRQHHPFHLIIPPTNTTSYMASYFPRNSWEWNLLPPPLIKVNSLAEFSNQLTEHL